MTGEVLTEIQQLAKGLLVADDVLDLAVRLVMMTHPEEADSPEDVKRYARFGAGPRAIQALISVSKVRALCSGRMHVSWNDLRTVALPILRHRIVLSYEAQAIGLTTDKLTEAIIHAIEASR